MKLKSILESRDLTFYTSIVCIVLIPLYIHWVPPFMILWVAFWFAENRSELGIGRFFEGKAGKLLLIFIALFLWQLAELIFSDSIGSGLERITKRLAFVLFPIVLFNPGFRIVNKLNLLLKLFAISTVIYIVYCFINAFDNSLSVMNGIKVFNPHPPIYVWENYFFGAHFSHKVHPTYMSMYVIISMIISLESVFDKSLQAYKRILWLIAAALFLAVLYLLSSRAGIISASVIIPVFLFIQLRPMISRVSAYIIIVSIVVCSFILLKTNSRINFSLREISKEKIYKTLDNDTRFLIWKSALEVIRQNLVFGVGTGDASSELKKEFLKQGNKDGYYENLNAHNQFLEILLENGIIGLFIFISLLCYIAFISISERNLILGLFLIMMFVFFMFETILNRLSGITFFPLFTFLLIQYKPISVYYKSPLQGI